MPWKTDLSETAARLAPLTCAERHALMDCCGEGACFQLDWLDDLHRRAQPRNRPWQARPRTIDREDN